MYYKFSIVHLFSLKLFLQRYTITKKRAEKLELHRTNNGPFESLDDLLQVQNVNNKWIYSFYKSIICGKKKTPRKIMPGLVVTPQSTDQRVQEIP